MAAQNRQVQAEADRPPAALNDFLNGPIRNLTALSAIAKLKKQPVAEVWCPIFLLFLDLQW